MKYLLSVIAMLLFAAPSFAQVPVELAKDQQALLRSPDPKLAANKKLVFDFWREALQSHETSNAPKYLAEDYIQHNPNVPTGRQAFMDFFGKMPKLPIKPTIDNLVWMGAEGDRVVLALRSTQKDSTGKEYTTTWFDMFRIRHDKIVEHWDYGTRQ